MRQGQGVQGRPPRRPRRETAATGDWGHQQHAQGKAAGRPEKAMSPSAGSPRSGHSGAGQHEVRLRRPAGSARIAPGVAVRRDPVCLRLRVNWVGIAVSALTARCVGREPGASIPFAGARGASAVIHHQTQREEAVGLARPARRGVGRDAGEHIIVVDGSCQKDQRRTRKLTLNRTQQREALPRCRSRSA